MVSLVTTAPIVIEERLRSSGLAAVLGVALALLALGGSSNPRLSRTHSAPWLARMVAAAGVLLLGFFFTLSLRVVARVVEGPSGRTFEVLYGPGGLVRQIFGPDQIVSAKARDLSFPQVGGWGYRGSLTMLRRAAVVTRRGDALELQLTRKRRFIVTVDEPDAFVTALVVASD